jgi:hypothetical protein
MAKAVGVTDRVLVTFPLSSPRKVAHPVHAVHRTAEVKLHPPRMAIAIWGFIGLHFE